MTPKQTQKVRARKILSKLVVVGAILTVSLLLSQEIKIAAAPAASYEAREHTTEVIYRGARREVKVLDSTEQEMQKVLATLAVPTGTGEKLARAIKLYSDQYKLDPWLLLAMAQVESNFNTQLVGSYGEIGVLQILPSTGKYIAKELNIAAFSADILFDIALNVRFSAFYLAKCFELTAGWDDLVIDHSSRALLAYNRGPTAVLRDLKGGVNPENGYATVVQQKRLRHLYLRQL